MHFDYSKPPRRSSYNVKSNYKSNLDEKYHFKTLWQKWSETAMLNWPHETHNSTLWMIDFLGLLNEQRLKLSK